MTNRSNAYALFIWFLSAFFLFYKYLLEVSPAVMSHELLSAFHMSGTSLGNLAACYFYAYLLMQIPMGLLLDKLGPRRITTICLGLCGIGTLILAFAHSVPVACLGRFVTGIGAVSAVLGCLKITTVWFPVNRFALMAGLMMSFGMFGAVFGEAPLSLIVLDWGWRDTLIALGCFGLSLGVLYFLTVRDHGPYESPKAADHSVAVFSALKALLSRRQTWLLSLYSGLAFAPVSVFGGLWGVPYLESAFHFTRTNAAEAVSLVFVGFAFGAPLFGWISDRLGKRLPVLWGSTVLGLLFVALVLYWPGLTVYMASFFLFCFGFFISGFLVCFSMIREANALILAATAIGFMNTFDAILGAVSDPFVGWLLDLHWDGVMKNGARVFSLQSYHLGMTALLIDLLLALLLLPFLKETHCEQMQ